MTTAAIEIVELPITAISNLGWPTDSELVQAFRASIRNGSILPPIQVNAIDGRHDIVDGFHRFAANQQEDATTQLCQVVKYEERQARYARIQATIGKPAKVLVERAVRSLQESFILDMITLFQEHGPYAYRRLSTDGKSVEIKYRQTLPLDTFQALETLFEHTKAALIAKEEVGRKSWDVNQILYGWAEELGKHFGKDKRWLMSTIFPNLIISQEGGLVTFAQTSFLFEIPDIDIRQRVLKKLDFDSEGRVTNRGYAENLCVRLSNPRWMKPQMTRREIIQLLDRFPTIKQINDELRCREQADKANRERKEQALIQQKERERLHDISQEAVQAQRHSLIPEEHSAVYASAFAAAKTLGVEDPDHLQSVVFTTISPKIVGRHASIVQKWHRSMGVYQAPHKALEEFIRQYRTLQASHPNWQRWEQAQDDITALRIFFQELGWEVKPSLELLFRA